MLMPQESVVELPLGCRPEAAISGGLLLQSEDEAYLLFNAISDAPNAQGHYESLGVAEIEFKRCFLTRFGSPNDEGRREHPLALSGLATIGYAICEVFSSFWASTEMERARHSAERIWGDQFEAAYQHHQWTIRHFLVTFHDSTFECLAHDLQVTLSQEPYHRILARRARRLMAKES
jgi:hypothetical protein